jgi:hypothetical protein
MLRLLLILLLNAAILVCPFRCMSCEAGAPSRETTGATCRCCHHASPAPDKEGAPGDPADEQQDCGCKHCICRGAVGSTERAFDVEIAAFEWAFAAILSAGINEAPSAAWSDDDLSWRLAGRPLRVFERSLQI